MTHFIVVSDMQIQTPKIYGVRSLIKTAIEKKCQNKNIIVHQ